MNANEVKAGVNVRDYQGRFFTVLRVVEIWGIVTADMKRVRKDGVLFGIDLAIQSAVVLAGHGHVALATEL